MLITLNQETYKQLVRLKANKEIKTGKALSFSKFITECIEAQN